MTTIPPSRYIDQAAKAYSRALRAYAFIGPKHERGLPTYYAYSNYRAYMVARLKKAGADPQTILAWKARLRQQILAGEFTNPQPPTTLSETEYPPNAKTT